MTRFILSAATIALIVPATAQEAPVIPAPDPAVRYAQYVPSDGPAVLPKGRTDTANASPKQRVSGYAGQKPQTFTQPIGQKIYTSGAYSENAPVATSAATAALANGANNRSNAAASLLKGLRGEVRAGWESTHSDGNTGSSSGQGAVYGLSVGYDYDIGNMFVGGFLSFDWSNATNDVAVTTTDATPIDYVITTEATEDLELGVRAGYWTGQNVNVYGLLAWTKSSQDVQFENLTDPGTETRSIDQDGWRLGAGGEVIFPHGIYGKAEYRYSDYGDDPAIVGNDLDRHQVLTGVGIRF